MFESRSFEAPDERMEFPNGHADIVEVAGMSVLRVVFEPGFRWSNDMSPTVGTPLCPFRHTLTVLSGRMGVRLSDGSERQVGAGEVASVQPGHDSWTIGNEPVVFVDFDPRSETG